MQRHLRPSLPVLEVSKFSICRNAATAAILLGLMLAGSAVGWAQTTLKCPEDTGNPLKPYGDPINNYQTNLVVDGQCDVDDPSESGTLKYYFRNVNIIDNGKLKFHDHDDIDFFAESILVENGGSLIAVSTQMGYLPQVSQLAGVLPYTRRLTIHLWGSENDPGIVCASPEEPNGAPCGIPGSLWDSNPIMAKDLMMNPPPVPPIPKNQPCVASDPMYGKYLPNKDCFYQYEIQDSQDRQNSRKAYFGHKVLAVSFGGTLQLFGSDGVTYLMQGQKCQPGVVGNECNPANTGTSWRRLTKVAEDKQTGDWQLTLDAPTGSVPVNWKAGDHIVVTTTDYLPSHSEERILTQDANNNVLTINAKLTWIHNTNTYSFASAPANVGPQNDPNKPDINRAIDTRAAVALLTRNIQIVSEGDKPSIPFAEEPYNYYYGGHTIVRQGFLSYQVQGVEFRQLGQGGQKGRYPVHFHMLRKTAQPVSIADDPTPEPLNYLKDCSINESMTRWVTLHATQGMYLARNVGYKSIGHGYYLEDATEINNRLYSNIGIFARAAIMDEVHNPRQVPGILADNQPVAGLRNMDYMPYRSDYNHPTVFWITNGWNDFQYNFAAGAATCGACYWWIGAGVSGPSQYQTWDGYASQQISRDQPTNLSRAGITPLKNFVGNSCVAAMSSFQMNGQTAPCLGMLPSGEQGLSAVESHAPLGPDNYNVQPFQVYYPVLTDLHNPTICIPDTTTNDCSANRNPCDGGDYFGTCTVTQLDHYTTSFNFAQTNFAAVWLRKGWDLFSNGAVTDVQTGGLNFITGGGYTRSDVNLGEWLLARNTVLVGHTQTGNPYASDVGPFNGDGGLQCDPGSTEPNFCAYADGGVSFNLPSFPGQKLLNIYDGPSHQDSNAYMDINVSPIADCSASPGGSCADSEVPLARNFGVLQNKRNTTCYLPNAAIAWKQPNGFYYPPAFHSKNLWFSDVDIRHFVVEPLFKPVTPDQYNPFEQDQTAVNDRYCTHTTTMFDNFNSIDRQTVLNDDDGTLTGLVGSQGGVSHPSISINEDPFFNAPLSTPECLSDINVKPPLPLPAGLPYTATTSPYEWLSTAIIAGCSLHGGQCIDPADSSLTIRWGSDCGSSFCRGVPLYREYLTKAEYDSSARPQIRMMGQDKSQRSTLSLNHAAYYIDTTQNCTSQGGCPKCVEIDPNNSRNCLRYDSTWRPSIFLKNETYYVYFIYATPTTKQRYDIYVPDTNLATLNVQAKFVDPNGYAIRNPADTSFIKPSYSDNILSVDVDLTGQGKLFSDAKAAFCRPKSYCMVQGNSCVCKPGTKCTQNSDCSWGPSDIDCPPNGNDVNTMNCFGFSFTMPSNWVAPAEPLAPDTNLFQLYTDDDYFKPMNVIFKMGKSISPKDACVYNPVPTQ